jgi:hypothetical protein
MPAARFTDIGQNRTNGRLAAINGRTATRVPGAGWPAFDVISGTSNGDTAWLMSGHDPRSFREPIRSVRRCLWCEVATRLDASPTARACRPAEAGLIAEAEVGSEPGKVALAGSPGRLPQEVRAKAGQERR